MKFHLSIFLLLIFAFSISGQNQTPPAPKPTVSPSPSEEAVEDDEVLRIGTEEVNLNVRVVDGANRPVMKLSKVDFKVFENDELQEITSFSTAEIPMNYALVIDNSRSLRTQLEKIVESGKIIIDLNRPKDETTVVRFVSADKIGIVQDFTTNKSALKDSLSNLFVEGGQTAIIDAIYLTTKRLEQYEKYKGKDDYKRRALIVISDGDDRGSAYSEQEMIDLLRQSEVQIYAVGFVNGLTDQPENEGQQSRREKSRAFLNRLARETGGKVYFPNSIDELPEIANDISNELRTQYMITYAPTGEGGGAERFKNIKVVVRDGANREKRTAIARSGRIVSEKQ